MFEPAVLESLRTGLYDGLTGRTLKCFFEVYNRLGYGFLEKVYERSMVAELLHSGLAAQNQVPIRVFYKGKAVGDYFADIVVNDLVVIEIKSVDAVAEEHEAQLINYLRATNMEIGRLLNFGKKPEVRRKIYTNDRKEDGTRNTQKRRMDAYR